jgi:hypothetical protein
MTFLTMVSKGVLLGQIQFHTLPQEKQRTGMIILPNVAEELGKMLFAMLQAAS